MNQEFSIGVVGIGLIGGSVLRGTAAAGLAAAGWDLSGRTAEAARGCGFQVLDSLEELAARSQVVVVSSPPSTIPEAVVRSLSSSHRSTLVIDTASVKAPVVEAVKSSLSSGEFGRYLPAHPLAGSENAGWDASGADLLEAAIWAVCPTEGGPKPDRLPQFSTLLSALGGRAIVCEPERHDQALAATSHMPHVLSEVLAMCAVGMSNSDRSLYASLSGGGLRDMIRIAKSDFGLWREILDLNEENVRIEVARMAGVLDSLSKSDQLAEDFANLWTRGSEAASLVRALRWSEMRWEELSTDANDWTSLLDLGMQGRSVREFTAVGETLHFQASSASWDVSTA